jgi:hypothetical protein
MDKDLKMTSLFDRYMDHENCRDSAVCKLCSERTKDRAKSTILRNNNTSTLWRHLENELKREYKIINDIQTKNKQEKYNQKKLTIDPITKLFGVNKS